MTGFVQGDFIDRDKKQIIEKSPTYKLVTFFYKVLSVERGRNIHSINQAMDLSLAKKFLKVIREELDLFPSEAFEIAQGMVYDLITNEKDFRLRFPVSNLGILGQAKMRFITEELFKRRKLREMDDTPENFDELYEKSLLEDKDGYKYNLDKMLEDD